MAGEGRTPSTRNARTSGQADSGTGQHMPGTSAPAVKVGRLNDSPSKASGPQPAFSNTRRGEASGIDVQPPKVEQNARLMKDSGAKTERERTFARVNAEVRSKLDGTGDRAFFPSGYEAGTLAQIAKGDKYAGTKPTIRKNRAQ